MRDPTVYERLVALVPGLFIGATMDAANLLIENEILRLRAENDKLKSLLEEGFDKLFKDDLPF